MSSERTTRPCLARRSVHLLCLCLLPAVGAAQVCPDLTDIDPALDAISAFDELRVTGRLGDGGCNSEVCTNVTAWEALAPSPEKTGEAGPLLDSIRESALALPPSPGVAELQTELVDWQQMLAQADITLLPTAVWKPAQLILFAGRPDEVDFESILDQACPETVGQCLPVFETSACVYTHAVLQRRVLVGLLEENRQATITYLARLNRRWTAFNSGGRSLFPWELLINGEVYRHQADSRGFVEPPTHQWIIAHPAVALEYAESADDGFNEALTLEIIGWYGWRWGGSDGASMIRPLGGSIVTSWTGDSGGDLGYGVMIHLPRNWSLGVTRRSVDGNDDTTFLLSVDLGKFLLEEQRLRQNLIETLRQ